MECDICKKVLKVVKYDNGTEGIEGGKFSVVKSWSKETNDNGFRTPSTKSLNIHRMCGFSALEKAGVKLSSLI